MNIYPVSRAELEAASEAQALAYLAQRPPRCEPPAGPLLSYWYESDTQVRGLNGGTGEPDSSVRPGEPTRWVLDMSMAGEPERFPVWWCDSFAADAEEVPADSFILIGPDWMVADYDHESRSPLPNLLLLRAVEFKALRLDVHHWKA